MTMGKLVVLLPILAGAACGGRSGARDSGFASERGGGEDASVPLDGPSAHADSPSDLPRSPDAGRVSDSRLRLDLADSLPLRFACSALAPLAVKGPFSTLGANQALFTDDRSMVVVQGKSADDADGNDVLVVRLPGGEVSTIATQVFSIEWLAPGSALLLKTVDRDLVAAPLDGAATKVLARGSYAHSLSPDGQHLFSFSGCEGAPCTLDMIDTTTGATTRLSDSAATVGRAGGHVVFSPSGRFLAFGETRANDAGQPNTVLHVFDQAGRDYTIASQPGALHPTFLSDDLLIFSTRGSGTGLSHSVDLRGHVPGTGDRCSLIATGYDYQAHWGYTLSTDRQWMLGARSNEDLGQAIQLAAVPLDGGESRVLANDLVPYWSISMPLVPFGLVGEEHVVYVTMTGSPAAYALATVPLAGGAARLLGTAWDFVSSPLGDLVAFSEYGTGNPRLHVVNLKTAQDTCTVPGSSATALAFLPDGRGLVFREYTSAGSGRLVYLSVADCAQVELAKLDVDRTDGAIPPSAGFGSLDPTSCFAIVRSNVPSNAGTSLVLLPQ